MTCVSKWNVRRETYYTAPPKPISGRRNLDLFSGRCVTFDVTRIFFFTILDIIIPCHMNTYWLVRLESFWSAHAWDTITPPTFCSVGSESYHAKSDQRMGEENGRSDDGQDEKDVQFRTEVGLGKSNRKICSN